MPSKFGLLAKLKPKINWAAVASIAAVLAAIAALASWYFQSKADENSRTSNSIAAAASTQSYISNTIAQTANAQSNTSNLMAQTAIAQSDISNSIAQTAVAQINTSNSLLQEANIPDIQQPESNCPNSDVSAVACQSTPTTYYPMLIVHDQFIFTNKGGGSDSLKRVTLTDNLTHQYTVQLYSASTNQSCPSPLNTIPIILPHDILLHNTTTWYMRGIYQDIGYNPVTGGFQHLSMKEAINEYMSWDNSKIVLTWTFHLGYEGQITEKTNSNVIHTPNIDFKIPSPACYPW